jgi:PAS domain S-box-containing protein
MLRGIFLMLINQAVDLHIPGEKKSGERKVWGRWPPALIFTPMDNMPDAREAPLRLNAIFRAATDGIIVINQWGIMEMVNPAAAQLFGYTESEMIGQNVSLVMPSPHAGQHDDYLRNYLRTGKARIIGIGRDVIAKKKSGELFPCRLSISKVDFGEGRYSFTGILHDLTEQKAAEKRIVELNRELEARVERRTAELEKAVNRLLETNSQLQHEIKERELAQEALLQKEQELRESLKKEKELNELKSRFVTTASHEFRTPLSTILTSAELIEQYTTADKQERRQRSVNRIKSAVGNLNTILNDFLSLGKLEEGVIRYQPEVINVNTFGQQLISDFEENLKTDQRLTYEPAQGDPTLKLDPQILRNICLNLLSNASKYSPADGEVVFRIAYEDGVLHLTVQDFGIGIPEADQQHLFSRFFRAGNVENIKGTGLGLHIVGRYLELMNGEIDYESKEGKGTTFYISIPIDR